MNRIYSSPVILLFFICVLGVALRFFQLGVNAPSLTWDEVAWGYNAYSLSLYGEDEFGRTLPVDYFESFGDFKPPVYAYITVLPVIVFGLTEFAVRFPSAFFGSLSILITYFLVLEIFKESKYRYHYTVLSSFFLAISPWHINLSRAAFEANVATFFIMSGVWLYLLALRKNLLLLLLSAFCFVMSMYTFNTARIVSPLLVIVLFISSLSIVRKHLRFFLIAGIFGALLLIPTLPFLLSPQASLRFQEVNIFSDVSLVERANKNIEASDSLIGTIVNNRRVFYAREYVKHYFDNLNPSFLFIVGDGNPKFSTRDVGQIYLWNMVFLLIGSLLLFRKKEGKWWLIPAWIIIGIIPAGTARETPHALRIETVLPTVQILVAYGVIQSFFLLKKRFSGHIVRLSFIFFGLVLLVNVLYYLHGYYAHYPRIFSGEWQYGYEESIAYVSAHKHEYDTIYITDKLGRPYVYYLFYEKTNPKEFQKTADIEREVLGFVNVKGYGNYVFLRELPHEKATDKTLFVNTPEAVPSNANVLKHFKLLNGNDALIAYTL